jgi:hypothetical protein
MSVRRRLRATSSASTAKPLKPVAVLASSYNEAAARARAEANVSHTNLLVRELAGDLWNAIEVAHQAERELAELRTALSALVAGAKG